MIIRYFFFTKHNSLNVYIFFYKYCINSVQSKLSSINNSLNSLKTLSDIDLIKTSNTDTLNQKEQSIKTKELNIKNSELEV